MVSRRHIPSAALIVSLALAVSGCQAISGVVDQFTGTGEGASVDGGEMAPTEGMADESTSGATDAPQVEENVDEESATPTIQSAVPACADIYSSDQVAAFEQEGRQPEGDISQDGYGYGTTDQELIAIVEGVRADLRVSCTWYLPPEFSSTTSVSILSTEAMGVVEDTLGSSADSQATLGSGTLWTIDVSSSNISGEYIANEAHFITTTECPESLAESNCSVWIASTNSSGSAEALTRDAASVFGALD